MKTIREDIRNKTFKRVYLLTGEEDYLIRMYRDNLKAAVLGDDATDMNYNRFVGAGQNVGEITELMVTLPFFADHRLVLIEDAGLFGSDNEMADAIGEIPESTVVVIVESKADKRTRLYKEIKKYGYICEFTRLKPEETAQFVASRLGRSAKKITRETCDYFVSNVGGDLYNIVSELDKLISYVGERDVITIPDIDAVCVMQVENRIFEIVDALLKGNRQEALKIWFGLIALRESPMGLLRFMTRQYMRLGAIREMSDAGRSDVEIGSSLHTADWMIRRSRQQLRNIPQARLDRAVSLCTKAEEDFKSGRMEDEIAIEILLANLSAV